MPDLILKSTGKRVYVPDERLADALASKMFEAPSGDADVNVELRPGLVGTTKLSNLEKYAAAGVSPESEGSFRERERDVRVEREHGGILGTAGTIAENALNEATLGGFGAAAEFGLGEDYTEERLERSEANPTGALLGKGLGILGPAIASGGSGLAGQLARATPLGKVTQISSRIAKAPLGASRLAKTGRVLAGGALEGGATGFGTGVQELTDMSDPLTLERVSSSLSSNMLYGAGVGAAAGTLAKAAEVGLHRTKIALDAVAERSAARAGLSDDFANMTGVELRAARKVEEEAIEAARIPARKEVADEIASFRQEIRDQKVWLATKGSKEAEVRAITKRMMTTERGLDNLLDDPKLFAEEPHRALSALRRQEAALDDLMTKHADDVRATFVTDTTGTRASKLDAVPAMLERNRALQQRIAAVTGAPQSRKLASILEAEEVLKTAGPKKQGMAEQLLAGAAFSGVAGAVASTDLPGAGFLAPLLGAKAAGLVGSKVFGRLGSAAAAQAARASKAVGTFLDVAKRVTPAAPVLVTKVLSAVRYAPEKDKEPRPPSKSRLADAFRDRSDEIRGQVALAPDGKFQMRPEARKALAAQLSPVAALDPLGADKLETLAARRMEFLAEMLPKRPDMGGVQMGPDTWQPSDMEMREFARYAAAVEDPTAIVERLGAGTVTPEDAEVMREVYPEMYADIQRQIIEALPTLRRKLPYQKQLALSIFSGIPVDPATRPGMLKVLQAQFAAEPDGAMQPPMPKPEFGSVKSENATPAQQRSG